MTSVRKILIVDDDIPFAESNKDLLEAHGFEVLLAHTGAEGLALAREIRPDVIILDVMMETDTAGIEAAKALSRDSGLRQTGVLLVTGVVKALKLPQELQPSETWLPVNRILDKPIAPERLLAEIERVIHEKEPCG